MAYARNRALEQAKGQYFFIVDNDRFEIIVGPLGIGLHRADILEIKDLCNDKRCQTIAYIGNPEMITPLLNAGVKGIDRIVPIGKTMDFDLIWDGYNIPSLFTRIVIDIWKNKQ